MQILIFFLTIIFFKALRLNWNQLLLFILFFLNIHTSKGLHDFVFHLLIEFDLFFRGFQFILLKRLLGFSFDWLSILFRDLFWSFNDIFFHNYLLLFFLLRSIIFSIYLLLQFFDLVLKHSNYIVFSLNQVNSFFNCIFYILFWVYLYLIKLALYFFQLFLFFTS